MIYKLENERLIAEIYPARGANIIKLFDKELGIDILRSPEKLSDFETQNPYLYGMPVLFPPNRISDAEFEFEKRTYIFPVNEPKTGCFVHGTMHETAFVVSEKSRTRIKLHFNATNEHPYLTFPHAFSIEVEYILSDEKLLQTITIHNKSDANMPVGLGFHTTFKCFGTDGFNVQACVEKEFFRNEKYLPTGEYRDDTEWIKKLTSPEGYNTKKELSALFELGDNHLITIRAEDNININYSLDKKYKYLMIFNTGSEGKYVCIEPQSWISNCPNIDKREQYGFTYIKPDEKISYNMSIYAENNN